MSGRGCGESLPTPENIGVLRACVYSASKLLIFAASRRKRILNPFSRSSANFAYLIGIKPMAVNYVVDRRSTRVLKKEHRDWATYHKAGRIAQERLFLESDTV